MTLIHRIVNTETGEIDDINYTKKELDEVKVNQARIDAEIEQAKAKATAKAAILAQLGITAEQAKLLLS
jgi:hypothetical protein